MKKKTQEQFEEELKSKFPQIQVLGKYDGSNKKIRVSCSVDKYSWDNYPCNLLRYGCPVCSGKIMTTNSFKFKVKEIYPNVEVIGEWNGSSKQIKCHCNTCGLDWEYKPRSILKTGCPRCNESKTRSLTNDEYVEKINNLFNNNVVVLDKYVNMDVKIKHKCLRHDYEYIMSPSHSLRGQSCKYCAAEKGASKRIKSLSKMKEELKNTHGKSYQYVSGYKNYSTNAIFRHYIDDGKFHDFKMAPGQLITNNYNCPCCAGYQVYKGYNDFNTKRPELANYLIDKEEGTKYTEWSGHATKWKCPECGNIINKKFSDVSSRGLCCPRCSDGVSYPNKFIYNSLIQIKDELDYIEREFHPSWCKYIYNKKECYGIYDIYFIKDSKKYIIEMDGGLGHGNRSYVNSEKSKDELIYRDKIKDQLALKHNIELIRIDCDYGKNNRYQFILNNIYNSKLSKILNLSFIDFEKSNRQSQQSLLLKAVELWNDGYTVGNIAIKLSLVETTITNYLKTANKYGICDSYSIKESRNRSTSNKVVCITTRMEFNSIIDGAKFYNINENSISKCCRHKATFGGYYNNEKLIWMYKYEYDNYPKEKINEYIPKENNNFSKVVCLNTGEVFDGIIYAAEKYKINKGGISACCTGKNKYSGKDLNGNILVWRYLDDYNKLSKNEITDLLTYKSMGKKKVICLNTLEIFNNAYEASEWCGLYDKLIIQRCCRNEIEYAGFHPSTKEKLNWLYYKDYLNKQQEAA